MVKNSCSCIMLIFLSLFGLIRNKSNLKTKNIHDDILDYESDKDPATNYNQYYLENSLETFSNQMFNLKKTPDNFQRCLIDNKFSAARTSRKFLMAYNDLVNSLNYAKIHNKSLKIETDTECHYLVNQIWDETSNVNENHHRRIYIVPKRYFLELFRTEFITDFLKYMICIQTVNNKNFFKSWRVFLYEKTYDQLFGNYCTISNIFFFISKQINEKTIQNPFFFLGKLLANLFDKIGSHIAHIATQYDLDKI